MQKINILFFNFDENGVNYYRTLKPATQLYKDFGDKFNVEINNKVDWNNDAYLKEFQIIHFHNTMVDYKTMPLLMSKLKALGIITIIDADDYWDVHEHHPIKDVIRTEGLNKAKLNNIKLSDYVTTTTPIFADYIRPFNKNVVVLENAIDDTEDQWRLEPKAKGGKTRLLWLGGSSHHADLMLLGDAFHKLKDDPNVRDKYQLHLAGFDLRGKITELKLNQGLEAELAKLGLLTQKMVNKMSAVQFDLDQVQEIPQPIKDAYRGRAVWRDEKPIDPANTVWSHYEKIFTTNYSLIKDGNYLAHLKTYNLDMRYPNEIGEQPYIRHKTKTVFEFAQNYRFADVALAPIKVYGKIKNGQFEDNVSNRYQFAKSNLKIIEAAFHKMPVIASNIPIYNFDKDFVDGKNVIFVNPERQEKDFHKKMKMLIENPNMVTELGEAAYETVKEKYSLKKITEKRAAFYEEVVNK